MKISFISTMAFVKVVINRILFAKTASVRMSVSSVLVTMIIIWIRANVGLVRVLWKAASTVLMPLIVSTAQLDIFTMMLHAKNVLPFSITASCAQERRNAINVWITSILIRINSANYVEISLKIAVLAAWMGLTALLVVLAFS